MHKLLHTERLMAIIPIGEDIRIGETEHIICTFCADCGQFIKQVTIKNQL